MLKQIHCARERYGNGEGHLLWQVPFDPNILPQEQVQLAYVDIPVGSPNRVLQWRAGLDEWLSNRTTAVLSEATEVFNALESYLAELRRVVPPVYDRLRDGGCIYVHCAQRYAAYAKVALDEMLGRSNFVNELIWNYEAAGRSTTHFLRGHDTIFLYKKGKDCVFHPEACGRRRGRGRTNHMRQGVDETGRVYYSLTLGEREYRYYEDDVLTPGDVWNDIPLLPLKDRERTGLDPQRPETLLRRILESSSDPGDPVLAPYDEAGSFAASAAACGRLSRTYCGAASSFMLSRRRLLLAGAQDMTLYPRQGMPKMEPSAVWEGKDVTLESFRVGDAVSANPMLDDGLYGLDLWAAGRVEEDVFHVNRYSLRYWESPTLNFALPVGAGEGTAGIMTCDAWGRTAYYQDCT